MAAGKKSFIVYVDWKETFDNLPNDKAGELIKHMFAYVNDENPKSEDILINAVFANIKNTLKRDLRKYEEIREKRVLAGKASADKRQQVLTGVDTCEQVSPVNDNGNDNGSVNDNKELNWKNSFEIYLSDCKKAYKEFNEDVEAIKTQSRLNPGIDVKLSIEKGFINFWGTEAGWKHKKKSRSKDIDWRSTIINSIQLNRVYIQKTNPADMPKPQIKLPSDWQK